MGVTTDRGVEVGIDYWEFTCPWERGRSLLYSFPGGYEVRRNERGEVIGWRGYTHSALVAQGKGRVGWSPEDERMGVHFSLSSEALSVLAALDERWRDLSSVMDAVHTELDGHSTRVDLCWDETSGLLDLSVVREALRNRDYTARWREWQYLESEKDTRDNGPVRGETFYMGSSKSDSQLRVYDKRAERLQKGHAVEVDHWVRCELQLRRKRADAVSRLWAQVRTDAEAVVTRLTGYLRSMVEFKEPGATWDTNVTRRPIARWWVRFLAFADKARLAVVKAEARTVGDCYEWVDGQVAPTLALIHDAWGEDVFYKVVRQLVRSGRDRQGPRHKAILLAGEALAT